MAFQLAFMQSLLFSPFHSRDPSDELWMPPRRTRGAPAAARATAHGCGPFGIGVAITGVQPGFPAAEADVRPGDVLVAVDGVPVATITVTWSGTTCCQHIVNAVKSFLEVLFL